MTRRAPLPLSLTIARSIALAVAASIALAACTAPVPAGPDVEREARWRAEIVPALIVGDAVDIPLAESTGKTFLGLYAPAAGNATAIVLVHGSGVHPDWGIVGALRMNLSDRGYTTLSIQMPVRAAGAPHDSYLPLMPAAADRIAAAVAWLQRRGARDIVVVSHSLGSRMSNAYFERTPATPVRAWASIGIVGGDYSPSLASRGAPRVLDVYGEQDFPAVLRDAPARAASLRAVKGARQVRVAGADHFFAGKEAQLATAIAEFLAGN